MFCFFFNQKTRLITISKTFVYVSSLFVRFYYLKLPTAPLKSQMNVPITGQRGRDTPRLVGHASADRKLLFWGIGVNSSIELKGLIFLACVLTFVQLTKLLWTNISKYQQIWTPVYVLRFKVRWCGVLVTLFWFYDPSHDLQKWS